MFVYLLPGFLVLVLGVMVPALPLEDDDIRPARIVNGNPAAPGERMYQASLQSKGYPFCGAAYIQLDREEAQSGNWVLTAAHCVLDKTSYYTLQTGELPYQVSMQFRLVGDPSTDLVSTRSNHFCGGTLIADRWILTAAHCTVDVNSANLQVVEGALDIADRTNPTYSVTQVITHPYDRKTKIGDLALLRLEANEVTASRLNDHPAVPIRLAPEDFDPTGYDCIVSGWGRMESHGADLPNVLMETSVRIVSQEGCAKMLLPSYPWDDKTDSMICAGGEDKDACQGDSGGPLVCELNGERFLIGIVSWGVGCATEGVPGCYTNVRKYKKWIEDQIANATAVAASQP